LTVDAVLELLKSDKSFWNNVTHHCVIPGQAAVSEPLGTRMHPSLAGVLKKRGIDRLYIHQQEAFDLAESGQNLVVVTPTASGKTLCYNLPVLNRILHDPRTRALYIFPTKALAYDQYSELQELVDGLNAQIGVFTYDGDTSPEVRKTVRQAGHIVLTNPDMLHQAILPHHTKWMKLFENLQFVVLDELHSYRGVFGSHMANVLRRLNRVAAFYGSHPVYLCSSATIRNPGELASMLTQKQIRVIDRNGAPSSTRHFLIYNPPVVSPQLGIRKSAILEASRLASRLISHDIQTIVFARSRVSVEILTTYLQNASGTRLVKGYRGGYLPRERREIESGLRSGKIMGVVSTNALELGVDIGGLDASVLVGYPGTIASTWQQAGRAGRRTGTALTIMIATSSPLDQFIAANPEYLFSASPEMGLINPDNLYILSSHLKCAAFELPFRRGENFGVETTDAILSFLEEQGVLHLAGDTYHWADQSFPAESISLRSASRENVVIIDRTAGARVIGEVDLFSAPMLVHTDAIYIHQGRQYHVDYLDYAEKKAYVTAVDVDYYTDASMSVDLSVLEEEPAPSPPGTYVSTGELKVTALVTMFKKIKMYTHENIGSGPVHLPEQEMHTEGFWLSLDERTLDSIGISSVQAGLLGISHLLSNVATVYLMCDPKDISVVAQVKARHNGLPTIFVYDNYPGGVGFSKRLPAMLTDILADCMSLLAACPCADGCPGCVGPLTQVETGAKAHTRKLLLTLIGQAQGGVSH